MDVMILPCPTPLTVRRLPRVFCTVSLPSLSLVVFLFAARLLYPYRKRIINPPLPETHMQIVKIPSNNGVCMNDTFSRFNY